MRTICDNLAARFAPGTITTPSGALAMRASYSETPKNVAGVPCVYLEVVNGTIVPDPGQWKFEHNIDVVFLYSKRQADTQRQERERRRWLPTLWGATQAQLKIGLGAAVGYSVDKAVPNGGWEFTEETIGGDLYDGIRLHYTVYVTETVSLVA